MRFRQFLPPARAGRNATLLRRREVAYGVLAFLALASGPAAAQSPSLKVELNKLEPQGQGCRAYVVVTNDSDASYKAIKLDLVMFRTDGVIGRRFALDLAPMKPKKRSVKLFDLDDTQCDQVGSLLVNDVMDCSTDAGPVDNCLGNIGLSSLTNVQLSK